MSCSPLGWLGGEGRLLGPLEQTQTQSLQQYPDPSGPRHPLQQRDAQSRPCVPRFHGWLGLRATRNWPLREQGSALRSRSAAQYRSHRLESHRSAVQLTHPTDPRVLCMPAQGRHHPLLHPPSDCHLEPHAGKSRGLDLDVFLRPLHPLEAKHDRRRPPSKEKHLRHLYLYLGQTHPIPTRAEKELARFRHLAFYPPPRHPCTWTPPPWLLVALLLSVRRLPAPCDLQPAVRYPWFDLIRQFHFHLHPRSHPRPHPQGRTAPSRRTHPTSRTRPWEHHRIEHATPPKELRRGRFAQYHHPCLLHLRLTPRSTNARRQVRMHHAAKAPEDHPNLTLLTELDPKIRRL